MVSRTVEKQIYEKYSHRCSICGGETNFDGGEIDHIKPKSRGGTDDSGNLQWLCPRCNKFKGNRLTNAQVRKQLINLGISISNNKGKKKMTRSFRCKLPVSRRNIMFCPLYPPTKKRADKSCLRANVLTKKPCNYLLR